MAITRVACWQQAEDLERMYMPRTVYNTNRPNEPGHAYIMSTVASWVPRVSAGAV